MLDNSLTLLGCWCRLRAGIQCVSLLKVMVNRLYQIKAVAGTAHVKHIQRVCVRGYVFWFTLSCTLTHDAHYHLQDFKSWQYVNEHSSFVLMHAQWHIKAETQKLRHFKSQGFSLSVFLQCVHLAGHRYAPQNLLYKGSLNGKGQLHLGRCHMTVSRVDINVCVCVCLSAALLIASAWAANRNEPAGRSVLTQAPVNPLFSLFLMCVYLCVFMGGGRVSPEFKRCSWRGEIHRYRNIVEDQALFINGNWLQIKSWKSHRVKLCFLPLACNITPTVTPSKHTGSSSSPYLKIPLPVVRLRRQPQLFPGKERQLLHTLRPYEMWAQIL